VAQPSYIVTTTGTDPEIGPLHPPHARSHPNSVHPLSSSHPHVGGGHVAAAVGAITSAVAHVLPRVHEHPHTTNPHVHSNGVHNTSTPHNGVGGAGAGGGGEAAAAAATGTDAGMAGATGAAALPRFRIQV
jgi:hypothetical protein